MKEDKKPESTSTGPKLRKVLLHQSFTISSATSDKVKIASITESALYDHKGFEMYATAVGVRGDYKGVKFMVPWSNIVVVFE